MSSLSVFPGSHWSNINKTPSEWSKSVVVIWLVAIGKIHPTRSNGLAPSEIADIPSGNFKCFVNFLFLRKTALQFVHSWSLERAGLLPTSLGISIIYNWHILSHQVLSAVHILCTSSDLECIMIDSLDSGLWTTCLVLVDMAVKYCLTTSPTLPWVTGPTLPTPLLLSLSLPWTGSTSWSVLLYTEMSCDPLHSNVWLTIEAIYFRFATQICRGLHNLAAWSQPSRLSPSPLPAMNERVHRQNRICLGKGSKISPL